MTGDPAPPNPRSRPTALALAVAGVLLAGLLSLAFSDLPAAVKPWNLSVVGAVGLFAAARVGLLPGLGLTALALALKDAVVYLTTGMEPYPPSYLYFPGYAVLGWALLRRTGSPVRIGATAVGASLLFFLVSNFVSWVEHALPYDDSLAGLLHSYAAGLPFYTGTLLGDVGFTAALFAAHAALCPAAVPAVVPAGRDSEGTR
ncbi:MAG: hypothetical protein C0501_04140 [Isosphaera sp.]|nr:hypothetical protein [Isosphaera sp.]